MASKRDPRDWDRVIMKLSEDPFKITGMENDVFRILKFSYDNLPNDTTRSCFAYCCLYPDDSEILVDDLLDFWIGEGFLDDFSDVHEALDQGLDIIKGLKAAGLLESCKSDEHVKMHDVRRDMALWIFGGPNAKMINRYVVFNHVDLLEAHLVTPNMETERASLWGRSIRSVAQVQSWPNAFTFMACGTETEMFPSGFFHFMLKVLKLLGNFDLAELPPSIGELVELQFLDLSGTQIRELPVELKNLTKMKYLLLDRTRRMEVIPRQVLSSFSMLRVFRLFFNSCASGEDAECNILSGTRTNLLELLQGLPYINDVSITLFDASSVEKLKNSPKIINCLSSLYLEYLTLLEFSSSSVQRMGHLRRLEIYKCEMRQLRMYSEPDGHGVGISRTPHRSMPRGCFHNLSIHRFLQQVA